MAEILHATQEAEEVDEQLLKSRKCRFHALSCTANWLDLTFPQTSPHMVSSHIYLGETDEHLLAEVGVQMFSSPQPSDDIKNERIKQAIACLNALGYRVGHSDHQISSFRDVGHAWNLKSNHERLQAYSALQNSSLHEGMKATPPGSTAAAPS